MPAVGDLLCLPHVDHDPISGQGYTVCYEHPAQQARAMTVFVHIGAEKAALLEVAAYRVDQITKSELTTSPSDNLPVRRINPIALREYNSQSDLSRFKAHRLDLLESLAIADARRGYVRSLASRPGMESRGHSCPDRVHRCGIYDEYACPDLARVLLSMPKVIRRVEQAEDARALVGKQTDGMRVTRRRNV